MLYDALFAIQVDSTPCGPAVGRSLWRWLLTGSTAQQQVRSRLEVGALLARSYGALRALGATRLRVRSDSQAWLELEAHPEEPVPRLPERLPPGWEQEPAELWVQADLPLAGPLSAVVQLRLCRRHLPEVGALTGAVRLCWTPGIPPEAEDLSAAVRRSLPSRRDAAELRDRLRAHGDMLTEGLCEALARELSGGADWLSRVLLLWGAEEHPDRFSELLRGLPAEATPLAVAVGARCRELGLRLEAIDGRGVPGRVGRRGFSPTAEVIDG